MVELRNRVDAVKDFYDNEVNDYCGWKYFPDAVSIVETEVQDLALYPSPSADIVYFDLPDLDGRSSYELIDAAGRTVLSGSAMRGKNQIDIRAFESGIYLLRISDGTPIYQGRVFKN